MDIMFAILYVVVIAQTGGTVFDGVHTSVVSVEVGETGKSGTGYIICTNIQCVNNGVKVDAGERNLIAGGHNPSARGAQDDLTDSWRAWLQNEHQKLPVKTMLVLTTAAHVLNAPGDDDWPNKVYVFVHTDVRDIHNKSVQNVLQSMMCDKIVRKQTIVFMYSM